MSARKPQPAELISVERARKLAERALCASGLSEERAAAVADVLIEAELAGRSGHGLIRVPGLCGSVGKEARGEPKVVREGPGHAVIDAKGETGYLAASMAIDLACDKAAEAGVAGVGVRDTTHAGFMGYYARRASARGMIGAVCAETFPRTAPTGSTEALLGTNPLAVAIPAEPHDIVVDLSTASVTNGALMLMKTLGVGLPPGLAFDADGAETTDAAAALAGAVVPFGGPKGYCIAFVVQILSSALVGMEVIPERGGAYGMLAAAVAPEMFTTADEFAAAMSELRRRVKALRTEDGEAEVLLPGERAWLGRAERLEAGFDVAAGLLEKIEGLAGG